MPPKQIPINEGKIIRFEVFPFSSIILDAVIPQEMQEIRTAVKMISCTITPCSGSVKSHGRMIEHNISAFSRIPFFPINGMTKMIHIRKRLSGKNEYILFAQKTQNPDKVTITTDEVLSIAARKSEFFPFLAAVIRKSSQAVPRVSQNQNECVFLMISFEIKSTFSGLSLKSA